MTTTMRLTVALILVEWAAGTLATLVLIHRRHGPVVGPGFTWLLGGVAGGAAVLAAVVGASEGGGGAVPWRTALAAGVASVALAQVLYARRRPVVLDGAAAALAL